MNSTSRTMHSHTSVAACGSLAIAALLMLTACTHTGRATEETTSTPTTTIATESPLLSGVTDQSGRFSALRFPQPFEHKFSVIATGSTATVEQVRRWIAADLSRAFDMQPDAPRLDRNARLLTVSTAGFAFRTDLDIDIDSRSAMEKGLQFDISVSWVTLYNAPETDLVLRADEVRDQIEDAMEAALDGLISKGSAGSLEYVR